jgi:hypothetical protein
MCTIGYGDIHPETSGEFIVVICLELIAGVLIAYVIGEIGLLFTRYNMASDSYRERQRFVLKYLKLKNIPKELLLKVKRYLDYNYEVKRDLKIDESEVMDMLNDDLRITLTLYTNGKILKTVTVLSVFPLELFHSIMRFNL